MCKKYIDNITSPGGGAFSPYSLIVCYNISVKEQW